MIKMRSDYCPYVDWKGEIEIEFISDSILWGADMQSYRWIEMRRICLYVKTTDTSLTSTSILLKVN